MDFEDKENQEESLRKSVFCIYLENAIEEYNKEQNYEHLEMIFNTLVNGCMRGDKIIAAAGFDQKVDVSDLDNMPEEFTGLHLRYLITEKNEAFAVVYTSMEMYEYCPTESLVEMYLYDILIRVYEQAAVKALVINPYSDLYYVADRGFIKAVLDTIKDNTSE